MRTRHGKIIWKEYQEGSLIIPAASSTQLIHSVAIHCTWCTANVLHHHPTSSSILIVLGWTIWIVLLNSTSYTQVSSHSPAAADYHQLPPRLVFADSAVFVFQKRNLLWSLGWRFCSTSVRSSVQLRRSAHLHPWWSSPK